MKETETQKAIEAEAQNLYSPDEPCAEEKLAAYIAGRSASDEAKDGEIKRLKSDLQKRISEKDFILTEFDKREDRIRELEEALREAARTLKNNVLIYQADQLLKVLNKNQ